MFCFGFCSNLITRDELFGHTATLVVLGSQNPKFQVIIRLLVQKNKAKHRFHAVPEKLC